tara:strand:- start:374 stop:592 length:219 start_codon:yes stop_codon:yes gene_type:complete
LIKVISKTFDINPDEVQFDMTPLDVDAWDSLGQLLLINNVEESFNVILELEEIFRIMKLGDILEILEEKGKI